MARFAEPPATGAAGFHPDDVMHLSRAGRLVFLSVFGNVEHIRAIRQFMEVFLRLGSLEFQDFQSIHCSKNEGIV